MTNFFYLNHPNLYHWQHLIPPPHHLNISTKNFILSLWYSYAYLQLWNDSNQQQSIGTENRDNKRIFIVFFYLFTRFNQSFPKWFRWIFLFKHKFPMILTYFTIFRCLKETNDIIILLAWERIQGLSVFPLIKWK